MKKKALARISSENVVDDFTFHRIYNEFYTRLCYFASRLLPECTEVEDIVQDVFLKLFSRWNNFNDFYSVKSFLYISVKNSCLNFRKHENIVRKHNKLVLSEMAEDKIIDHILESEVLEMVHKKLSSLPKGCRDVMHLSYFQGMKNKEIATALNVSVNTIKTQKLRGMSLLRMAFKVNFSSLVLSLIN